MRALLQRVERASVAVDGESVAAIGPGLVVLLCVERGDGEDEAAFLARKIARLRIFNDDAGKMNLSLVDVGGEALAVSQFTLAAEWRKGNRPGFTAAAGPEDGNRLYERFCQLLEAEGIATRQGRFAAHMKVDLVNDGPVTIWMDTRDT